MEGMAALISMLGLEVECRYSIVIIGFHGFGGRERLLRNSSLSRISIGPFCFGYVDRWLQGRGFGNIGSGFRRCGGDLKYLELIKQMYTRCYGNSL